MHQRFLMAAVLLFLALPADDWTHSRGPTASNEAFRVRLLVGLLS